ncbi:MAG: amidohydrolase family protein [Bacteroidetes bacterium]|nr:amidohydrolase family protein [Bacteroidota bacterium]
MSNKKNFALILFLLHGMLVHAQSGVLIKNVQIFNGKTEKTATGNVLIVDNIIQKISAAAIAVSDSIKITVVDGKGKFLMPGLIDAHYHAMFAAVPEQTLLFADIGFATIVAGQNAQATLLRGFTSIRDLGGPVFGLKMAIDKGVIIGPRIWPSGAFISQTGGHGDFRLPTEIPYDPSRGYSYAERLNATAIADNPDEVRKRTREQLMLGASQIKLMAGGGVSSHYDPIDVSQYTEPEFRAAVEAADNWGTYVTVHAYTPHAIRTAIQAGVKCIEHGQLADEDIAKLMAEKNIWWSLQPFLDDDDSNPKSNPENRKKQLEVAAGTDKAYALAKKYKIRTAWGTDALFDQKQTTKQGKILAKMSRWYTPFEILKMATSDNADLLALSGKRSPYTGKLGVIEEGALADLLIVDGNPLKDINLVADPANFILIMKDGVIYKNTIR